MTSTWTGTAGPSATAWRPPWRPAGVLGPTRRRVPAEQPGSRGRDTDHGPGSLDTHAKALAINLDPAIYGSVAETGAGPEAARWVLTAGAASRTTVSVVIQYRAEDN